jgi:hypothetical protein
MTQQIIDTQLRVRGFESIQKADEVIRRLLDTGFSKEEVLVVCPPKFEVHFRAETPKAETPSPSAAGALAAGGLVGASLGGLALAATLLTGGAAGPAAIVLLGGGALAGGISNLIAAKGYDEEADDYYKLAVKHGLIVVGVSIPEGETHPPITEAERILEEAGGKELIQT